MATKTKTAPVVETETNPDENGKRSSAAVKTVDYSAAIEPGDIPVVKRGGTGRKSPWKGLLQQVKDDTLAGRVPKASDGKPKFAPIGTFNQTAGAGSRIREFRVKADRLVPGSFTDFEFKAGNNGNSTSTLWVRYVGK